MNTLKISQIALLVGAACATPALWAQEAPADAGTQAATDVGKISVQGQPGSAGLIQAEETPKARSSVNKAHLDTLVPTATPYQAIEMLPGVSTFSQDGTGLFGGGLRVRGANSDQMGFTINGAPVNDSGNFAVFPQEYTDLDNLCEVFVTQGSTDTEAPHVGASGGNVGMTTCAPTDKFAVTFSQSFGQLSFHKSFVRVNTGLLMNDMLKAYVSVSKTDANKFKGPGKADKYHVDFAAEFRPTKDLSLTTSVLYNRARNNNILTLSYNDIATLGYNADYPTQVPQHLVGVNGTAQVEALPTTPNTYYDFTANPFKNWLWTAKGEYKANKDLSFSISPYFWYGFGTGGSQLTTLKEGFGQSTLTTVPVGFQGTNANNTLGGGIGDLNGDGDKLDTILVYGSNVTKTLRPGVTLQTNARIGNHNLLAGIWYERARHRQTGPRQLFDNSGNVASWWQDNTADFIKRADGTIVNGRDQLTVSTGSSFFVQDSFFLVPDKLNVTVGLRQSGIKREFTNFANEASSSGAGAFLYDSAGFYKLDRSYDKLLPSLGLRYTVDAERQFFFNIAQNFRVPSNFSYQNLAQVGTGTWSNGNWTGFALRPSNVNPETSTNMDAGYRYASDNLTFSASVYHVDFKNRIATSFDPVANLSTDYNVGGVTTSGIESEAGYRLNENWSVYGSLSYNDTVMKDNQICRTFSTVTRSCSLYWQTAGMTMPDTPQYLAGLSVSYKIGGFFAKMDAKYTGPVFSTLVNDQTIKKMTLVNATAGYNFPTMGFLKNPQIMLNVVNLFDKQYVRISSPSGSSFSLNTTLGASGQPSGPFYYVGAPRFTSVTLRTDF